jgi:hypothetical protein
MNLFIKSLLLLLLLFYTVECLPQSKIEQSKAELKSGGSNTKTQDPHSDSSSDDDVSIENDTVDIEAMFFLFRAAYNIIYYTAIGGYYTAFGNYEKENHLYNSLTSYPYCNYLAGNYSAADTSLIKAKYYRLDVQNQFLFSQDDIYGNHLKLKFRPSQMVYLMADYTEMIEYIKDEKDYANLSMVNLNVGYDRLRFERFNLGWTMGLKYIPNTVNDIGLSFGFTTDIFVAKPLSLTGAIRWSRVNQVLISESELLARYHIGRCFISAGFEHLKIGTPTYYFISAGGGIYF